MSSSKVMFKLETLKEKSLESIDARIEIKEGEIAGYIDEDLIASKIATWRAEQEAKISDVFSRLGGNDSISDHRLSKFKLDPFPESDRYDVRKAENDLRRLQGLRTQIVAKAESLVADAEGNISLTKTQLSEFFGL